MAISLKLIKIAESNGVVLPSAMLARLNIADGDTLYATETADGYLITPHEPALADELTAGHEFMNAYRDTFTKLAR